jgi:hypothetical protein
LTGDVVLLAAGPTFGVAAGMLVAVVVDAAALAWTADTGSEPGSPTVAPMVVPTPGGTRAGLVVRF